MNIRVVRKKIKSIKNVKKITKAMEMVSAVKMRKAQQLEKESRPYREGLADLISKLAKKVDPSQARLLQVDTSLAKRKLVVVVTSNKGLAGSFNINVLRFFMAQHKDLNDIDFVTVGDKGAQFFGRLEKANILADFSGGNLLLESSALFDFVLKKFESGLYKTISIVYSQFISTLRSNPTESVLLPLTDVESKSSNDVSYDTVRNKSLEIIIEPSPKIILEELLKSFIENIIRGALISSEAVEHSSRMMAMKSATDNATELIYSFTLLANRLRQEKITNDLLDMVTAKESVEQN